eukprot:1161442-Pelagomonas_calceolata.AAC.15
MVLLRKFTHLFAAWSAHRAVLDDTGPFNFSQARSEDKWGSLKELPEDLHPNVSWLMRHWSFTQPVSAEH